MTYCELAEYCLNEVQRSNLQVALHGRAQRIHNQMTNLNAELEKLLSMQSVVDAVEKYQHELAMQQERAMQQELVPPVMH